MDTEVVLIMGATLVAIVINGLILNRLARQVQKQCNSTQALAAANRSLARDRRRAVDQSLQQLTARSTHHIHLLITARDPFARNAQSVRLLELGRAVVKRR
jgi:uncharacterized protein involved in cysteine biosynthesis